jgi:hypothetical protein
MQIGKQVEYWFYKVHIEIKIIVTHLFLYVNLVIYSLIKLFDQVKRMLVGNQGVHFAVNE